MPTPNQRMFQQQHYNAIAKDIRTTYAQLAYTDLMGLAARRTLEDLALRFAARFKIDNDSFDPINFLLHCSPDQDLFPLAELWED